MLLQAAGLVAVRTSRRMQGMVKGPTAEHCGVLTCVAATCTASNSLMSALKDSLLCQAHQLTLQPRRSQAQRRKCMCAA